MAGGGLPDGGVRLRINAQKREQENYEDQLVDDIDRWRSRIGMSLPPNAVTLHRVGGEADRPVEAGVSRCEFSATSIVFFRSTHHSKPQTGQRDA
jgi:hypothetical protein